MTATVTISIEIELAWGFHDQRSPADVRELSDDGAAERAALRRLLELCDEFKIPISFDIVGHLLLKSCEGQHDGPHPNGWFKRDPGTDVMTDPLFYAPELGDWIRDTAIEHELCTHTFSHVLCDEISPETMAWELDRAADVHDEPVASLVPPRHREPPRNVLLEHDIEVLRLPVDETVPDGDVSRFLYLLTRDQPVVDPSTAEGILETRTAPIMSLTSPALSSGTAPPHRAFRLLPRRVRQRLHRKFLASGLKRAVKQEGHIHLWTHLYNLAHEAQWPPIRETFEQLAQTVSAGQASVSRMNDLPSANPD